jgi:hypothetical protein
MPLLVLSPTTPENSVKAHKKSINLKVSPPTGGEI